MKLHRHLHLIAAGLTLGALFIFAAESFGAERKPEAKPKVNQAGLARLYGPLPQATIDAIFEAHGFTRTQRALFAVVLKVPAQFGGTNAPENLVIIARSDMAARDALEETLARQCARNQCTYEQAAKIMAAWQN